MTASDPGTADLATEALVDAGFSSGDAEAAVQGERRLEAVRALPPETLDWLLRHAPARELWKWLNAPERDELLYNATRGFQRTPGTLRQNAVRKRLVNHLATATEDAMEVLALWAEASPAALTETGELETEAAWQRALPGLVRRHGAEAALLALIAQSRLSESLQEAWQSAVERADEDVAEAAETQTASRKDDGSTAKTSAPETEETWQQRVAVAEHERTQAESARQETERELAALKTALAALETTLDTAKTEAGRIALKAAQEVQQEKRRAEAATSAAQTQLAETKRHAERDGRRLKVAERERDELTIENKRLKRQLRQSQNAQEELRREIAALSEKLTALQSQLEAARGATARRTRWQSPQLSKLQQSTTPGRGGLAAPAPTPVSPFDTVLTWNADGRPFRVSPREIKRAIDTNDETFVNRLIQALDPLRVDDDSKYGTLMKRLRDLNPYYARVLTETMTRVLVDASNVARQEKDARGKGQLRHLLTMRDNLRRHDCFPIVIYADASLPYNIDEPDALNAMAKRSEVIMAMPGQEADELLAREARRTGAYVVTNDRNFYLKVSPDYEPPRITFRIHDSLVVVDEF